MNDYFCYIIHDSTGVPIYVGMGRGYRHCNSGKRNAKIEALISFGGTLKPVKVKEGMTKAEAHECEKALIAFHGRADLGKGELLNLCDGGAGPNGTIVSAETRAKMRAAKLGRSKSAETRANMSTAQKGKVIAPETRAKISTGKRGRPWSDARREASRAARS
jgi:hypothetical protein